MRKAFLAASALTLALSASAWAQSTPPAASTGLHKPAPSGLVEQNSSTGAIGTNAAAGEILKVAKISTSSARRESSRLR